MNTNTTPLGSQPVPADPIPLRSLALDHVLAGRYLAAEAGTGGHLARALLMQDRVGDARSAIARAWKGLRQDEGREETLLYTRSRLLFLRMLCAALAGRGYDRLVAWSPGRPVGPGACGSSRPGALVDRAPRRRPGPGRAGTPERQRRGDQRRRAPPLWRWSGGDNQGLDSPTTRELDSATPDDDGAGGAAAILFFITYEAILSRL